MGDIGILERLMDLAPRSRAGEGDTARIRRAMQKALRGVPVTLGYLGGSITQGASASKPENRWASLVTSWWRARFPGVQINEVNAGIGATGSLLGVHRVGRDLLSHEPDFVIMEFAVNDPDSPVSAGAYEGLIRKILSSPASPGLMVLFMTNHEGVDVQHLHQPIARHYELPMVRYRDAVWPEVEAGRLAWTDISPDEVHPNDDGHAALAYFITLRLDEMLAEAKTQAAQTAAAELPAPLSAETYENAALLGHLDIKPTAGIGAGWEEARTLVFRNGWISHAPGSSITFEVKGRNIGIIYKKYNTNDMGRAEIRIDGGEAVLLEGHFPCWWGGYAHSEIIAGGLPDTAHAVTVTFLREHDPESTGAEFMICGLLVS